MMLFKVSHVYTEAGDRGPDYEERYVYPVLAKTQEEAIERAKEITALYCRDKGHWSARAIPSGCFSIRCNVNGGD